MLWGKTADAWVWVVRADSHDLWVAWGVGLQVVRIQVPYPKVSARQAAEGPYGNGPAGTRYGQLLSHSEH